MSNGEPPESDSDRDSSGWARDLGVPETEPEPEGYHDGLEPGGIIAPSPVLFVLAFLVGTAIELFAHVGTLPWPWHVVVGAALLLAGLWMYVGAIRQMWAVETLPAHEDEPDELLTGGPFGYSRNPIYVGQILGYAGTALVIDSAWPLVALVPLLAYLPRVVDREEEYLEARFGEEYERYRSEVRRWL